jgi:LytS/YehU family sensor histidine kinase
LRIAAVIGAAACLSASLWLLVGSGWATILSRAPRFEVAAEIFRRAYPLLFAAGVLLFFLAAAAGYLLVTAEAARTAERKALELKILAREAELRALKAQINPHFLFNSLNSVMALINSQPVEARRMCLLLSDFLRNSLRAAATERIPLAEELSLLEGFLDIERIRFGTRLQASYDIDEECRSCLIPPLLLQPLVENALIHGIAQRLEGGEISLRARKQGSRLMIEIANPCDSDRSRTAGGGIGLANVQSRLAAVYGSDARLDTFQMEGMFHAEIRMPA